MQNNRREETESRERVMDGRGGGVVEERGKKKSDSEVSAQSAE